MCTECSELKGMSRCVCVHLLIAPKHTRPTVNELPTERLKEGRESVWVCGCVSMQVSVSEGVRMRVCAFGCKCVHSPFHLMYASMSFSLNVSLSKSACFLIRKFVPT